MVIVVTDCGGNMKGSRLADVLDDTVLDRTFWEKVFAKMSLLQAHIEEAKGPGMSIDDAEYRWVQDRIEYWMSEERVLTKSEMQIGNLYWKKYN